MVQTINQLRQVGGDRGWRGWLRIQCGSAQLRAGENTRKLKLNWLQHRKMTSNLFFFWVPEFQTNLRGLVAKKLVFPNDGNPTVNSFSNTQSPNPSWTLHLSHDQAVGYGDGSTQWLLNHRHGRMNLCCPVVVHQCVCPATGPPRSL